MRIDHDLPPMVAATRAFDAYGETPRPPHDPGLASIAHQLPLESLTLAEIPTIRDQPAQLRPDQQCSSFGVTHRVVSMPATAATRCGYTSSEGLATATWGLVSSGSTVAAWWPDARSRPPAFAEAIWRDGGDCELYVAPGGHHGYENVLPEAQISKTTASVTQGWVRRVLTR